MKKINKKVIFIILFVLIFLNLLIKKTNATNVEDTDEFLAAVASPEVSQIKLISDIEIANDVNIIIDGNDKTIDLNNNYLTLLGDARIYVNYNTTNKFILEDNTGRGRISSIDTKDTSRSVFKPINYTYEAVEMIVNSGVIETNALWIFEDTNGFNLTINNGEFSSSSSLLKFNSSYNSNVVLNRFTLKNIESNENEDLRIDYYGKYSQKPLSTIISDKYKLLYYIEEGGEYIEQSKNTLCGKTYKNNGILYMLPAKGLEINNITFDTKEYGYSQFPQKKIVINNESDEAIKVVNVRLLKDDGSFSLGNSQINNQISQGNNLEVNLNILPGKDNNNILIRPVNNLLPGNYSDIILITTENRDKYRVKVSFEVTKVHLNLEVNLQNWEYESEPNEPTFSGNLGGANTSFEYAKMIEGVSINDLDFSEEVPTEVGKYVVKLLVEETENYYGGSATNEFEITRKQIETEINISDGEYIYSGKKITPEITVTFSKNGNQKTLEKDLDYEIEYGENINAGQGTVTIKSLDTSLYKFEKKTEKFTINPKEILSENVIVPELVAYTENGSYPNAVVTDGGQELVKDIDYEVQYEGENGNEEDKVLVRIIGKENYCGTIEKYSTITKKKNQVLSFSKTEITKVYSDYNFTILPNHTVGDGILTFLSSNTDVVEVNSLTGEVSIIGIGNATITAIASQTQDFFEQEAKYNITINKANYNMSNVKFNDLTITFDNKVHNIEATGLPEGVKVVYSNNEKINVGVYKITANFIGDNTKYNSIQSKKAILTIKPKSLDNVIILGIKDKTYTGKNITQTFVVIDENKILKEGTDYALKYSSNKKIGTAKITITGKGNYTGSITKTFKITPKGTSLKKLTAGKKQFKATWKAQKTQTTGYEVQYSTNKKFNGAKKVKIKKNKITSSTVKKLNAKKKYYVRIRTYKTVNGRKLYSGWSKVLKVKTKK